MKLSKSLVEDAADINVAAGLAVGILFCWERDGKVAGCCNVDKADKNLLTCFLHPFSDSEIQHCD